ncbi:hypothetical protein HYT56_04895 [Candidatus Woesearchaeota archaeon]|nr:hypothetical protein [Candidatus Woesearchaeota archaeon]
MTNYLEFYSRKYIQKAILEAAKNKEVAIKYANGSYGKRPDIISFENDVFELAKQGATSFHVSEEHWKNPLLLKPGMAKTQLDNLRVGWDLIIDIDTKFIEYSRATALLLVEALKFHDIKNIGLKFSGNNGFHIGIPFQSLPREVNNVSIKDLFPEAPRAIAAYLKEMIKSRLRDKVLEISTLQEISKATGKKQEELMEKNIFNPFSIIEIDTILISNRHMYRAPYSINEKKGLVSIPLELDELKNFDLKKARIENVKSTRIFLPEVKEREATQLVMQALDAVSRRPEVYTQVQEFQKKQYDELKTSIPDEFFPPCIQLLLKGVKSDGRKRALFILINFLRSIGYSMHEVENIIKIWNQRNYQPLQEGYLLSQLSWHKKQQEKILPPNCSNLSYYKELGVKCPDEICNSCKNPVRFAKRRFFANIKNKPKIKPLKKGNKTKYL